MNNGRPVKRSIVSRIGRTWKEVHWYVVIFLGILGITLGLLGFRRYYGSDMTFLDYLYFTLQLFSLEFYPDRGALPWELEVARFLLPFLTLYTITRALFTLFTNQILALKIRFLIKNHVVVCGLGEKGLSLVKDFLHHGEKVVVIEIDPNNPQIQNVKDLGAMVIIGDAANRRTLLRSGVTKAKVLMVTCDDDSTNVEVALKSIQIDPEGDLRSYIHLDDMKLASMLHRGKTSTDVLDGSDLFFFNVFENGARQLFMEHPPDVYADRHGSSDIRMLVVGFEDLGEALVVQALKIGHYGKGRKLIITIADNNAMEKERIFRDRYRNLDMITDIEVRFLEVHMDRSGCFDTSFVYGTEDRFDIIYICMVDDIRGQNAALNLNAVGREHPVPVVFNIIQNIGFASIMRGKEKEFLKKRDLVIFTPIQKACRREIVIDEGLDYIAKTFHNHYIDMRRREAKREKRPFKRSETSLLPWEELPENLKDSNRQQADHIDVKLRAVSCIRVKGKGQREARSHRFTDEEVDVLGRMEHNRWRAERALSGWTEGKVKDPDRKISPYMIEWEDPNLSESVKDYDREFIKRLPHILRTATPERYLIKKAKRKN